MLTQAQSDALKAYILTQPDLIPMTSGETTDYGEIARLLNLDASPTTLASPTAVTPIEIDEAADYSVFDGIQAGKRDSWAFFIDYTRNFSRNKVRKWITDVWGGLRRRGVLG